MPTREERIAWCRQNAGARVRLTRERSREGTVGAYREHDGMIIVGRDGSGGITDGERVGYWTYRTVTDEARHGTFHDINELERVAAPPPPDYLRPGAYTFYVDRELYATLTATVMPAPAPAGPALPPGAERIGPHGRPIYGVKKGLEALERAEKRAKEGVT